MQQHFQAIVTVLSLVNPLICEAMFAQIEAGQTSATRFADSTKAALTVLVILVIAALVGARVLQVFGVSLEAFSVAGEACWPGSGSPCCAAIQRQSRMRLRIKKIAHAGDLIRSQPGHDYRGHHARRRPYQATTAGHGTRRGGGGHGRNVDHDGARGP